MFKHNLLGRYKYVETIGRGSRTEVLKVVDKMKGEIPYALKILRDNEYLEKFKHAGQVLHHLDHKNILHVCGASYNLEEGEVYLLMKPMEHGNLTEYLSQNIGMSLKQKLLLMLDISHALAYVHEKGYVHCNVHAKNIYVTEDDKGIYGCLGGFEHALHTAPTGEIKQSEAIESMYHFALEEEYSAATDRFDFGLVMYELVTTQDPFEDLSIRWVNKFLEDDLIKYPSEHDPSIPKQVDELCMQAIKKYTYNSQSYDQFNAKLCKCILLLD